MNKTIHIDIEATTKYPNNAKVLEFAYIITSDPFTTYVEDMGHFYFSPEKEVPQSSVNIHGLNKAKLDILSEGKEFYQLAQIIREKFNDCTYITGYNSNIYDIPILNRSFVESGVSDLSTNEFKFIDFCRKARGYSLPTPDTKLTTMYRYAVSSLGLSLSELNDLFLDCTKVFNVQNVTATAHGALFDTFMVMIVNMFLHKNGFTC